MTVTREQSRGAVVLLGFLALVFTSASCEGCREAAGEAPSSTGPGQATQPGADEDDFSKRATLPEGIEFEPASPRLRQLAGEMDVKNRYASTVMLSLKDPRELPDCSGILLEPRLVLTAASCLCALQARPPGDAREETRADASSCAKRVFATSVIYGEVGHSKLKELTTQMRFRTVEGSVRPHPALELVLNARGYVVRGRADLALILLDDPLEVKSSEVLLAHEPVREGEFLVMAGYGHDAAVGGFYGARYFRKNRVVGVPSSEAERILYEQQGLYAYNGFDGGPCFREEGARRWLVGVASVRVGQPLECASTTAYLDWVRAEMTRAQPSRP
jgi:Trypsin-like peptidase domain